MWYFQKKKKYNIIDTFRFRTNHKFVLMLALNVWNDLKGFSFKVSKRFVMFQSVKTTCYL